MTESHPLQSYNGLLVINSNLSFDNIINTQDKISTPIAKTDLYKPNKEDKHFTSCVTKTKSKDNWSNSYHYSNNNKLLRVDNKGQPIVRGLSQHHISFADKTKSKSNLVEIIPIESFKPYNSPSKGNEYTHEKFCFCLSAKSNCCVIN